MVIELLLLLILASVWFGFYQIVKQQGRVILRLDAIEQRSAALPAVEPQGIAVGEEFPLFSLPDLAGNQVSLDSFRGKYVLLIHWNSECGFCDLIAPNLAILQADFAKGNIQTLLLAHGEAEANRKWAREHDLRYPILLYKGAKVPEPFAHMGTPSAYLLDGDGRVARPVAVGSEEVPTLAELAASTAISVSRTTGQGSLTQTVGRKPLSASRIVRDGLKAGAVAPGFALPDLNGRTVSLDDYRGGRVLLVFSDPHCGPCDQVARELATLDREHSNNGLSILMVGRGEIEENRAKVQQHGIDFPVVVQDKWRLSREYGIFSTPVAFLVDEDGLINKDVAIGPAAIVALAHEGLTTRKESAYELSH
jgi:peroxiredoxin